MFMVNKEHGFTLIEMMATVVIISILATGILPLSQVIYKRTSELELKNNLRTIRTALDEYKNEEIVIICHSGSRSMMAAQLLARAGFKDVRNLTGGMLMWHRSGYPV